MSNDGDDDDNTNAIYVLEALTKFRSGFLRIQREFVKEYAKCVVCTMK